MKSKKSGESKKVKVLWALQDAKDRVVDFQDAGHAKEVKTSKAGPLGNPFAKPDGRIGKNLGRS